MKKHTRNANTSGSRERQAANVSRDALLDLAHALGDPHHRMAILGEGNVSAGLSDDRFIVKASGSSLATLAKDDVVECDSAGLLTLIDRPAVSDEEIEAALLSSRVSKVAKKPSVEALFHAYCLSIPDVRFVGHAHPVAANQVLCSRRGREFAERRIFPDEVVCCGPSSVFVTYTDPGYHLAREIRERTSGYIQRRGFAPRLILLQNHGVIALGRTPEAVLAAMRMAEKAASIWVGAAALGGPMFLTDQDVDRIANRTDEHYRRKALNL